MDEVRASHQVYNIPTHTGGACWTDVTSAMQSALRDYEAKYGLGTSPSDDAILVRPGGDYITIEFEVPNA